MGDAGWVSLLQSLGNDRRGAGEPGIDGADGGDQLGTRFVQAPERSSVGAGRFDGDPNHLLRRATRVAPGRERLAGEVEPVGAKSQPGYFGRERPYGQRELAGGEGCERVIVVTERLADADQLDRADDVPAGARRQCDQAGRPGLFRSAARWLGCLAGDDRFAKPPRARNLRAQRRPRGSDGPRGEASLVVQHPQNGKIGVRRLGDRACDRVQRHPQIPGLGDPGRGIRQALDR